MHSQALIKQLQTGTCVWVILMSLLSVSSVHSCSSSAIRLKWSLPLFSGLWFVQFPLISDYYLRSTDFLWPHPSRLLYDFPSWCLLAISYFFANSPSFLPLPLWSTFLPFQRRQHLSVDFWDCSWTLPAHLLWCHLSSFHTGFLSPSGVLSSRTEAC